MRARRNGFWTAPVLALLALLVVGTPPEAAEAQTGSIVGTVSLEEVRRVRRRSANRYSSGTGTIQQLPVVAYLVGRVGAAPTPGAPARMVQQDTAFVPAALTIPVGGTVEFPNEDSFFHNVFSYSESHRFDLGRYPRGESKTEQFQQPGVVEVFCEVHDKMRGVIVVTENPFHAIVGDDGSFQIDGVPAGEYQLAIWSADHRPSEQSVTVRAGATSNVEVELSR